MAQVVVVIGGGPLSERAVDAVEEDALVIAADSGLDHAVQVDLVPTVLVGDLDSISAAGQMWAYAHDVDVREFPVDKDATDTELALAAAEASGQCTTLLVLGGSGDRLDHTLGTITALGHPSLSRFTSIRAILGEAVVHVLHPRHGIVLDEPPGTTFSLFALHGQCTGIEVQGAQWPLHDASLEPGATVGLSNEIVPGASAPPCVSVDGGVLTVVLP